ncbi:aspartate/glutamate racemase family protein [Brevibacillus fulvus]|uniref:Aspartate racemase n=1 Tax=Brevibacillus fulvus TaxID=1125967 RepID=A0A939BPC2_9BACL|nr:amino acid racemase [Brevibacillus fulvus]MBM7590295.1 aspartate racemase [Brevibacillus fulvus]
MMPKTVGILGGMGPMATVDLFAKIVQNTSASVDQEHIPILIYNNPQIPSRVSSILHGTESPERELIRTARCLEQAGADFLIMPCHTAHVWFEPVQKAIAIPFYSMVEITVDAVIKNYPTLNHRILLLGTKATLQQRLYQDAFARSGWRLQVPSETEQDLVTAVIEEVKASRIADNPYLPALKQRLNQYYSSGVTAVLGGCTEIPLLFPYLPEQLQKLDPTLMLAQKAVQLARQEDLPTGGCL